MRRLTRREWFLAVASAIVISALVIWLPSRGPVAHSTGSTSTNGSGNGSLQAPSSFTISGDVRGEMTLGAMVSLDLSLVNPNDFDLVIDRITVTVQAVEAPRADTKHPCTVADFKVRPLTGGVPPRLAANASERLSAMGVARSHQPAVGMLERPVNQDGCQGAVLTLGYEASGAELDR